MGDRLERAPCILCGINASYLTSAHNPSGYVAEHIDGIVTDVAVNIDIHGSDRLTRQGVSLCAVVILPRHFQWSRGNNARI